MKKIAFVGCGHIHAPAFTNMTNARTNVEVAAVWDHYKARAQKYAELLKSKAVESDDEIWNDASIDGVVICSETNLHGELVRKAAAAKKHMFVEKPIGFNAEEALEMAKLVSEAGVIFQTGYFMRGKSEHLVLKEQVEKVFVDDQLFAYIAMLSQATREHAYIELGLSPRGSIACVRMARAWAYLQGRDYVLPEDVAQIFLDIAKHRIVLNTKARVAHVSEAAVLEEILSQVRQPASYMQRSEYHV